jgi:hypothetical protein
VPLLLDLVGFVFRHEDVEELRVLDVQIQQTQDELPELVER